MSQRSGWVRRHFITGLLVTAPIAFTLYVSWWLVMLVDKAVVSWIPYAINPDVYLKKALGVQFDIPGVGILLLFVLLVGVGLLTRSFLGTWFLGKGDALLARMPFLRRLYSASKQVFETLLNDNARAFRQAILVEFPRKGAWMFAFLIAPTQGEIHQHLGPKGYVTVYLPTTPNPTSGYMMFVPEDEVILLDMPVENALRMLISMGLVLPDSEKEPSS